MIAKIEFTKGGYKGDMVEETFKPFTTHYMPFWWHFREVLRASDRASSHWGKNDGSPLKDNEQKELVAVSLLNYAVYTGLAEGKSFFEQMGSELSRTMVPTWRWFIVKMLWKAMYSSFYTSYNALCNLIYVIVSQKSPFGENPLKTWNYTPKQTINLIDGRGIKELSKPIVRCRDRLEIRDHLDHYWIIWHKIDQGQFLIDKNFKKGYAPIYPEKEVSATDDAYKLASEHLVGLAEDFNIIYHAISIKGGFLDKYLIDKNWKIDYSDYGRPHNGKRPHP
ncbi:MAG: hypothetical protein V1715_13305 [bacterium]